jgi:hypothetical protein
MNGARRGQDRSGALRFPPSFRICSVSPFSSEKAEMVASQGCQIFLGTTYQNGTKIFPNDRKICQKCHKTYEMVVKYSEWPQNLPTFSAPRPSKMYQNRNFRFGKIPSGNPVVSCESQEWFPFRVKLVDVLNEIGMLTSKVLTVTTSMSRTSVEAPR